MEIQIQQVLLQALNFGILLFVMTKFLYKPIIKILDERANKINEGLNAAEKSLAEQVKIEELKKREIEKSQRETAIMLEKAKKEAEEMGREIVEKAREEATLVIKKEEIALMGRIEKEEQKLKAQVGKLVTTMTENLLKDTLSAKYQQEIVKNQLKSLKSLKVD